jgi:hypothetical protein
MSVKGGPNTVTSGLVLELDAGNIKSYPTTGTTWFDKSGNANNGTLTNGLTFNTGSLGSIVFDGVDDYVKSTAVNGTGIMNPTLYGEVIGVNLWLQSTSNQANQYVITTGAFTGGLTGFCLVINDSGAGGNEFIGIVTSTKSYGLGSNFIGVNEWVNVCFTTDGTNMYTYKNGTLISTTVGSNVTGNSPSANGLQLSGPNDRVSLLFIGNIALTQIYNKALSANEVLQNYNATKGRFGL